MVDSQWAEAARPAFLAAVRRTNGRKPAPLLEGAADAALAQALLALSAFRLGSVDAGAFLVGFLGAYSIAAPPDLAEAASAALRGAGPDRQVFIDAGKAVVDRRRWEWIEQYRDEHGRRKKFGSFHVSTSEFAAFHAEFPILKDSVWAACEAYIAAPLLSTRPKDRASEPRAIWDAWKRVEAGRAACVNPGGSWPEIAQAVSRHCRLWPGIYWTADWDAPSLVVA